MGGNRSLDEFGGSHEDAEAPRSGADDVTPATTDPSGDADGPEELDSADALDPPASTFVWRPEGGPCAVCGNPTEERWRADEGLVCVACKEW